MKPAAFSSLASAKKFALSCEGFRALFILNGKPFVALTGKAARALREAGAAPASLLG